MTASEMIFGVAGGRRGRSVRALIGGLALTVALSAYPAAGAELDTALVIITSFPKSFFSKFTASFQARHPSVRVKVLNKNTAAAVSYIQNPASRQVDVFWASSPAAFEILKESGNLRPFRPKVLGIPERVAGYPVHDPDGFYTGFAVSGYGIMWNQEYLSRHGLPEPSDWEDLKNAAYFGHVGVSSPSRSGTTHMAVETLLQREGWERGWATLLEIGGNLATVTARSYGVPDGVNKGRFGIGVVIDFFAFSAMASGHPVAYAYPRGAMLLPANVAILKNGEHPKTARVFVDFLLSPEGQRLLLDPSIRRLPVRPEIYADAPPGYPNPFAEKWKNSGQIFDVKLSKERYHLVNNLFDRLITYRFSALNKAWALIHQAEASLKERPAAEAQKMINMARKLATSVPVSAEDAENSRFASDFKRRKRGIPVSERQESLETEWETLSRNNLEEAMRLAEGAISLATEMAKPATAPRPARYQQIRGGP